MVKPEDYVEEVEFYQLGKSSPEAIVMALKVKPGSIAKALYRAGRPDLAAPFNAMDWQAKKDKINRDRLCGPCQISVHQAHREFVDSTHRCKCGFCKTVSDNACH